jgi:disulfide bond formation protein DsbB
LQDLRNMIAKTKAVRCDEPSFKFLEISMAGWNVLYCLALILSSLFLFKIGRRRRTF